MSKVRGLWLAVWQIRQWLSAQHISERKNSKEIAHFFSLTVFTAIATDTARWHTVIIILLLQCYFLSCRWMMYFHELILSLCIYSEHWWRIGMVWGFCETKCKQLVSTENTPAVFFWPEPRILTRSWSEDRPHTVSHVLELIHQHQGGAELQFNKSSEMNLSGKCTVNEFCHIHSCWPHRLPWTHKCFHSDVVTLTIWAGKTF